MEAKMVAHPLDTASKKETPGRFPHSPRRLSGHLLRYGDPHAGQINPVTLRHDPHDGEDAGAQGRRDEIRGGEILAFTVVVCRRISHELLTARSVYRLAAKPPAMGDVDPYH